MKKLHQIFWRALIGGVAGTLIFAGVADQSIQGLPENAMPGPGGVVGPHFFGFVLGTLLGGIAGILAMTGPTDTKQD